ISVFTAFPLQLYHSAGTLNNLRWRTRMSVSAAPPGPRCGNDVSIFHHVPSLTRGPTHSRLQSTRSIRTSTQSRMSIGECTMGVMRFLIHPVELLQNWPEVYRAYICGPDLSVCPTRVEIDGPLMACRRQTSESGKLYVAWEVPGFG